MKINVIFGFKRSTESAHKLFNCYVVIFPWDNYNIASLDSFICLQLVGIFHGPAFSTIIDLHPHHGLVLGDGKMLHSFIRNKWVVFKEATCPESKHFTLLVVLIKQIRLGLSRTIFVIGPQFLPGRTNRTGGSFTG